MGRRGGISLCPLKPLALPASPPEKTENKYPKRLKTTEKGGFDPVSDKNSLNQQQPKLSIDF